MADIPLQVISENTSSERRITPSWSISQLRKKLEPISGVPPSSQQLFLQTCSGRIPITASDEETTYMTSFPLTPYAEIHVIDSRPPGARPDFANDGSVEKFSLPEEEYARKTDSVLAWKKAQRLGRFDPNAPSHEQARIAVHAQEIERRGITVGGRCRVGGDDAKRGEVKYVGEVKEIPSGTGAWVGIHLDEPVGKNDGRIGDCRYWGQDSNLKHGIFVRPERVEVGDFPVMDDLHDMEEI